MDGFIDNQGNFGVDGIVGPHHEKEGSYDAYIGVYQPCDGRNRVLYTLPESGISVLNVIPPDMIFNFKSHTNKAEQR